MKLGARVRTYITAFCVVLCLAGGLALGIHLEAGRHREPEITPASVAEQLERVSQLATARLDYRGLIRYEDGGIRFLTKKSFTMLYDAAITAGIDFSQAQITVSEKSIDVLLPKPSIQTVEVKPESLEFYDEKFALFNPERREDTVEALKAARENAQEHAQAAAILQTAQDQAELLVQELLAPLAEGRKEPREIVVKTTGN